MKKEELRELLKLKEQEVDDLVEAIIKLTEDISQLKVRIEIKESVIRANKREYTDLYKRYEALKAGKG